MKAPKPLPDDMYCAPAAEFSSCLLLGEAQQTVPDEWFSNALDVLLFDATLFGSEGCLLEHARDDDLLSLTEAPDADVYSLSPIQQLVVQTLIDNPGRTATLISEISTVDIGRGDQPL